ncbi:MAG: TlpA family protein disulfide reductase [Flavobacterium sp.]|nr:MAG: TlpA family protein disulfide reductase [Flavobacterium sp.]
MKINTSSELYSNFVLNIASGTYTADSTYLKNVDAELSSLNLHQNAFALNDRYIINNSSSYIFYLYRLNITRLAILKGDNRKRPPIESVFNDIKSGYCGLIRDKLLISFVQDYMRNPDINVYAMNALSIIKEARLKILLSQILSSKSNGAKAFDFVLTDTEGKLVRLNDFRGKVIVIDTWFNGCTGCIHLAERLKPIEAYYTDKNVVFLSVNVDKDKKRFIEGVNSNLYGAKKSIYLYTNGMGQNHPMILHYKYRGYPNLLIIDKIGQIISSNPPLPTNEKNIDEFKKLINSNL